MLYSRLKSMEININCDLGEKSKFHSIENDPKLLNIVNSANIACGYHAGDEHTKQWEWLFKFLKRTELV